MGFEQVELLLARRGRGGGAGREGDRRQRDQRNDEQLSYQDSSVSLRNRRR
jgi:hypothetical protein